MISENHLGILGLSDKNGRGRAWNAQIAKVLQMRGLDWSQRKLRPKIITTLFL